MYIGLGTLLVICADRPAGHLRFLRSEDLRVALTQCRYFFGAAAEWWRQLLEGSAAVTKDVVEHEPFTEIAAADRPGLPSSWDDRDLAQPGSRRGDS